MKEIILAVVAGLVLFLYAISHLSDTIKSVAGTKAQHAIQRFTTNSFLAVLVGAVVTAILGSSSAAIIITIVLVNAHILQLRQAMGIVLGANVGTTVSSQIIATQVDQYSPLLLLIGFVLVIVAQTTTISAIGKIILYFGILFFGLYTMGTAVEPLKNEPYFTEWMKQTESPLFGAITGALVTLVIQSSSATVGMAIVLAKKGMLGAAGGVSIMLGAELGTCSDTLFATIKGTRQAIKTGVFHLAFNLISVVLGLLLFKPFMALVHIVSTDTSMERLIANAHMLFNLSGALIFVWTIPLVEKMLNRLIPEKGQKLVL